jgi:hypothetical protein
MRSLVAIVVCLLFGGGLLAADGHGSIPVLFFANHSEAADGVKYLAKTPRMNARFSDQKAEFIVGLDVISLEFQDARPGVSVESDGSLVARANFLVGDSPDLWRQNVSLIERVIYRGLYHGIDMSFGGTGSLLKSEFLLEPGADAGLIRLKYSGAKSVSLGTDGSLIFELESGEVREVAPVVYQDIRGHRVPVAASYRLSGKGVVGFDIQEYDPDWPLVIDPAISYSTYLGGSGIDGATSVAIDGSGSAYVAGYTESTDFPIAGALQGVNAGSVDAFVVKFSTDGKSLVYATFIGGSSDDRAFGIAVDSTGSAVVTGWTSSANFPKVNASQATNGGGRDAFVLKLNPAGSALVYSTFLGGSGADSGNAIATDSSGNAYVTGDTTSVNFPVQSAFQATNKGRQDAFMAKINSAGVVQFATYLGGAGDDRGLGVAVDSANAIYISGGTTSPDFPVVSAFQAASGGGQDAFVAKLAANGASLIYSTYLGGSCGGPGQPEQGNGIGVDAAGNAYIAGVTCSTNFPLATPLQTGHGGGLLDAFVTKLNPSGSSLVYSTYLGGLGLDTGTAIAVDGAGNAFVTGNTASSTFPLVAAIQSTKAGPYDAFISQINPSGTTLVFSSYLGGTGSDGGTSIKVDSSNGVWVVGQTTSTDFPLLKAFQSFGLTEGNGFLTKLGTATGSPSATVSPSTGSGPSQTFQFVFTDPAGIGDMNAGIVLINNVLSGSNACFFLYDMVAGLVQLYNDTSNTWKPLTLGSGTVSNGQCTLSGAGASVTTNSTSLTLTIPVAFSNIFTGPRNIYASIRNTAGQMTSYQQAGTWTIPGGVPPTGSVSPASGSAISQSFQFTLTDTAGASNIRQGLILVNSSLNGTNSCYISVTPSAGTVALASDNGSTWSNVPLHSLGSVQNSQCAINGQGSALSSSGNNVVITLAMSFTTTYVGTRNIYVYAIDFAGLSTGWQQAGTWTVPGGAPPNSSVTPASGSGTSQVFQFTLTDQNGAADIQSALIVINSSLNGSHSCYIQVTAGSSTVSLASDDASTWNPVTLGGAGSVQNSQCGISGQTSSVSTNGSSIVLNLALNFTITYVGVRNVYIYAIDNEGLTLDWQQKGTWTVTGGVPPTTSVTPTSGSGTSRVFQFTLTDANGAGDIQQSLILINSSLNGSHSCYIQVAVPSGGVLLASDDGSTWSPVTLGVAGSVQNSQCVINGPGSGFTSSGNNVVLTLSMTFKAAYNGPRNVYVYAIDNEGLTPGWQQKGTWTVQ